MKIEKVIKLSNGYQIKLNNQQLITVDEDTLVKERLLMGKEIDHHLLNDLLKMSNTYACYQRAIKYNNYRLRSVKEMRDYLLKLACSDIEYVVNKLVANGYLNDQIFQQAFINDRINLTLDGPFKILRDLQKRGIELSPEQVFSDPALVEQWQERCQLIIKRQLKSVKPMSAFLTRKKLYDYLITMGYESSLINEVLDQTNFDDNHSLVNFMIKNQTKYAEDKLIKKAMQAGFNYYEIINYLKG